MVGDILLYVFLLHDATHVDLLGLFELIFLFLFDVLLHHCIYLPTGHVVLDLFRQFVEDALVLYHHSQQSLLKLVICQADLIVLVYLFVLCEMPKDFGELLSVGDKGVYLEDEIKVMPGLEYDFGIVFLLSDR